MKGLISIFALPQEIDILETTLYNLRRNATHLRQSDSFGFDITLCLSDELTDWNSSVMPKAYFEDKFTQMTSALCDWAKSQSIKIEYGNEILGCVSQRRHSLQYTDEYDFILWMDNDLMFDDYMLSYITLSAEAVNASTPYYIITPQITRQWDSSWDILVNDTLLNRPLNDNRTADVFDLSLQSRESVSLRPAEYFKFAGGWGTTISTQLLKTIGIPNSLGHYGLEDTYIMQCAQMLKARGHDVKQYIMENVLVCENHKYAYNAYLSSKIASIYRKEEFLAIANKNFPQELQNFLQSTR